MTFKELERRIKAVREKYPEPPTFEQFQEDWAHMDELSKALYVIQTECPGLCGPCDNESDPYWRNVSEYLNRMGLVQKHYDLNEVVKGLEERAG